MRLSGSNKRCAAGKFGKPRDTGNESREGCVANCLFCSSPFLLFRHRVLLHTGGEMVPHRKGNFMRKRFLEAGKIVGTHGIRGELRVEPWCDSPEFLKGLKHLYFEEGKTEVSLLSSRVHKRLLLVCIEGVTTVEQADALRGKVLYLNREDVQLEPGRYFVQDLLGLRAVDAGTGQEYGMVEEVFATGANDVYRIVDGAGREYLFPAVKEMIQSTDLEAGVVALLPIPGIFDSGAEEVRE